VFGTRDGSQLWVAGALGTILYSSNWGQTWKKQNTGTQTTLTAIFVTSDGSELWVTALGGEILHSADRGAKWEVQSKDPAFLQSIFGTSDGSELWAGGMWNNSVSSTSDVIIYSTDRGRTWQPRGTGNLTEHHSLFGTGDGNQLWTDESGIGGCTILHSSDKGHSWQPELNASVLELRSIFGRSDGSQLWAVGDNIAWAEPDGTYPYVSSCRFLITPLGAELQVKVAGDPHNSVWIGVSGSTAVNLKNRLQPIIPQANVVKPRTPDDPWIVFFDPASIGVQRGEKAYLFVTLAQDNYLQVSQFDATYDPHYRLRRNWPWLLPLSLLVLLIATLTALLFTRPLWNLTLYRRIKLYHAVELLKVPAVGTVLQALLKLTVLPWFVTNRRTLNAWVNANRQAAARSWDANFRLSAVAGWEDEKLHIPYVALPIRIENSSTLLLSEPTSNDFESLLGTKRSVIQIIGPGGSGKTTLASHIGDLALAGGEPCGFKQCRLLIWLDEDTVDVWSVVKRKVSSWFEHGESIEDELLKALLERGFLIVIVDRVSERSAATQQHLGQLHGSLRLNTLLLTSRQRISMEVSEQTFVVPLALDSSTLLHFMTAVIHHYFAGKDHEEIRPFASIQSQLELGKRLSGLITLGSAGSDGPREVPILPLPVVLFVVNAIRLIENNRSLDELPKSLPDVYSNYLRGTNPKMPGLNNGMSDEEMLQAAKALARLAIKKDYTPREFTRDQAVQCLKHYSCLPSQVDPLQRLTANGVLLRKTVGATTVYRFALDPVAEFLAAEAYFDDCNGKAPCLDKLLQESLHAQGFHAAVLLTRQARIMLQ
jgi:hypothetical protein